MRKSEWMNPVVDDLHDVGSFFVNFATKLWKADIAIWLSAGLFFVIHFGWFVLSPGFAFVGQVILFGICYLAVLWSSWALAFASVRLSGRGKWLLLIETPFVLVATVVALYVWCL